MTNTPALANATPAIKIPLPRILGVLAIRPVMILALGLILVIATLSLIYANALVILIDVTALGAVTLT